MTSADHQHETTSPDPTPDPASEQAQDPTEAPGEVPGAEASAGGTPADGVPADEAEKVPAGETGDGDGAGSGTMTDDLAKTQQDLVELTQDLQRLQAEYINYKRRVDRDRELVKQNAQFSVLAGLLPVLDDIDRAREHGELEGGFKAVAESLERIVLSLGLEKFGSPGDEFDPNLHEALMHSQSPDATSTTCQDIVHAGYRIGDRVVRPARVTVVGPADDVGDA